MRCPTLTELPSPPPNRTGWPWTEESPPMLGTLAEGVLSPRISIVTPSYNQASFLETALRSVLLQNYPDLEYIVIDAGSQDGSVDLIRRYDHWLTDWVSEPDHGQSDGINKGLARATGEILAWLNGDDLLLPGALHAVAQAFAAQPGAGLIYGDLDVVDAAGHRVRRYDRVRPYNFDALLHDDDYIPQPAAFFSRAAWQAVGPLRLDLHYAMDWDLWIKIGRQFPVYYLPVTLAGLRIYPQTKSASGGRERLDEILAMLLEHGSRAPRLYYKIGLWHYQRDEMRQARRYFAEALRRGPVPALRRMLIGLWIKTLLGARLVNIGRKLRAQLMRRA